MDCLVGFYFVFHANVRLRFKLAAGIGEAWTRDGGLPQGCPLSMLFLVAHLHWCKCLENVWEVKPQLFSYHLKCVSIDSDALLDAAHISNQYVLAVGQTAAPAGCVLLGTCADNRCTMQSWVISGEDEHWKVESDIWDSGGHLDTTLWGRAGTISVRIWKESVQRAAVGALLLRFKGEASNFAHQVWATGSAGI